MEALLLIASLIASPNPYCSPTPLIIKGLHDKLGEDPVAAGVTDAGNVVVIFTNPKSGLFTIVVDMPGNVSCFRASGSNFMTTKKGPDL